MLLELLRFLYSLLPPARIPVFQRDYAERIRKSVKKPVKMLVKRNELTVVCRFISVLDSRWITKASQAANMPVNDLVRVAMNILRDRDLSGLMENSGTAIALAAAPVIASHPSREVASQLVHGMTMLFGPNNIEPASVTRIMPDLKRAMKREDFLMGDKSELRDLIYVLECG